MSVLPEGSLNSRPISYNSYSRVQSSTSLSNNVYKHIGGNTILMPICITLPGATLTSNTSNALIDSIKLLVLRFYSAPVDNVDIDVIQGNVILTPSYKNEYIYKEEEIVISFSRVVAGLNILGMRPISVHNDDKTLTGCDLEMRWLLRDKKSMIVEGDLKLIHDIFFLPIGDEYDTIREDYELKRMGMTVRNEVVILNSEENRKAVQGRKHIVDDGLIKVGG